MVHVDLDIAVDTTTTESTGGTCGYAHDNIGINRGKVPVWTRQQRSQPGESGGFGHNNIGVNQGKVASVDTTTSESTGGTCGCGHDNKAPVVLDVDMDATTVRSAEGTCNSRCT